MRLGATSRIAVCHASDFPCPGHGSCELTRLIKSDVLEYLPDGLERSPEVEMREKRAPCPTPGRPVYGRRRTISCSCTSITLQNTGISHVAHCFAVEKESVSYGWNTIDARSRSRRVLPQTDTPMRDQTCWYQETNHLYRERRDPARESRPRKPPPKALVTSSGLVSRAFGRGLRNNYSGVRTGCNLLGQRWPDEGSVRFSRWCSVGSVEPWIPNSQGRWKQKIPRDTVDPRVRRYEIRGRAGTGSRIPLPTSPTHH